MEMSREWVYKHVSRSTFDACIITLILRYAMLKLFFVWCHDSKAIKCRCHSVQDALKLLLSANPILIRQTLTLKG